MDVPECTVTHRKLCERQESVDKSATTLDRLTMCPIE